MFEKVPAQEFYMYANTSLAIRINEQEDSLTGSMVDDIFFILQKAARRAIATGELECQQFHDWFRYL